jgi:hypothetical protein
MSEESELRAIVDNWLIGNVSHFSLTRGYLFQLLSNSTQNTIRMRGTIDTIIFIPSG